jgi:hypothetical protein
VAFDWLRTLDQNKVVYATAGKNVSKGNFVVHCPFCGADDAGLHMSVALKGRGWRCFRRPDHRGQHPARLLAALLGCSIEQAYRLVGDSIHVPENFLSAVQATLSDAPEPERKAPCFPSTFKPLPAEDDHAPSALPYLHYLHDRGFSWKQIGAMHSQWGLRYATRGPYAGRVIFPVRAGDGQLAAWTGRHIGASDLRYKSLSPDPEKAAAEGLDAALGPISDYLLFHRQLLRSDADTLYLVEGPFDALKLCVLGRNSGAIATCCFTATPSQAQVAELFDLFPKFKRRVLLLDRGTFANALRTSGTFAGMDLEIGALPRDVKDPGDLDRRQFEMLHAERGSHVLPRQ